MSKQNIKTIDYYSRNFSDYIECYRFYGFEEEATLNLNPDGNFEFIFQLNGDFAQRQSTKKEWIKRPDSFIGGLHSNSFQVQAQHKNSKLLSIKFKPLGAKSFINDRLNLFKNQLIEFEDLSPDLNKINFETSSEQNIVEQIELLLKKSYKENQRSIIDYALSLVTNSNGFISIKSLAKKLNISESHLRLKFNEEIGMSPKEYSKILRVKHISNLITSEIKLTELAYQLGYFDQSHLIKDFKAVTGFSPKKYLNWK